MTPNEAIEWLLAIQSKYIHGGDETYDEDRKLAIKTAISALKKQTPQKPNRHGFDPNALISTVSYTCPACNRHLGAYAYCPDCGQALDWGDSE